MTTTYRMIVGVDGSPAARRALSWAVKEAERRNAHGEPATVQAIAVWDTDEDAAIRALAAAVGAAHDESPDVTITGEVVHGDPVGVLCRSADGADLLVLGSHGLGHFRHTVLGSVAEACVREAICPILLLPMSVAASTRRGAEVLAPAAAR